MTLQIVGISSCGFAAAWFLWLVLAQAGDFLVLAGAAVGSESAVEELARRNLSSAGQIRFAIAMFAAKAALMGVLGWTGWALLRHWRLARWCALSYCGLAIGVALFDTFARLIFLTPPGEVVKVTPFVMDAAAILFANVLCGSMFLPEVTAKMPGTLKPSMQP
jgi:hypothetical protein